VTIASNRRYFGRWLFAELRHGPELAPADLLVSAEIGCPSSNFRIHIGLLSDVKRPNLRDVAFWRLLYRNVRQCGCRREQGSHKHDKSFQVAEQDSP
jgi:hypothetical protein